jgi:general secretion pathway protein J
MSSTPLRQPTPSFFSSSLSGFTLVELLVALLIMAALAAMTMRGVDAMVASNQAATERSDSTLLLSAALSALSDDLDAAGRSPTLAAPFLVDGFPGIRWDGSALAMSFISGGSDPSWRLASWSIRPTAKGPQLSRWLSHPILTYADRDEALREAALWRDGKSELGPEALAQSSEQQGLMRAVGLRVDFWTPNGWGSAPPSQEPDSGARLGLAEPNPNAPPGSDASTPVASGAGYRPEPFGAQMPYGARIFIDLGAPGTESRLSGVVAKTWSLPLASGSKP